MEKAKWTNLFINMALFFVLGAAAEFIAWFYISKWSQFSGRNERIASYVSCDW